MEQSQSSLPPIIFSTLKLLLFPYLVVDAAVSGYIKLSVFFSTTLIRWIRAFPVWYRSDKIQSLDHQILIQQKRDARLTLVQFAHLWYYRLVEDTFILWLLSSEFQTLNELTKSILESFSLVGLKTEYALERYLFHSPWCIVNKITRKRSSFSFRNVHLTKYEGFADYVGKTKTGPMELCFSPSLSLEIKVKFEPHSLKLVASPSSRKRKASHISLSPKRKMPLEKLMISEILESTPETTESMEPAQASKFTEKGKVFEENKIEALEVPDLCEVPVATPRKISNPVDLLNIRKKESKGRSFTILVPGRNPLKFKIQKKQPQSLNAEFYSQVSGAIKAALTAPNHDDGSYAPIVLRLAWHCCATYDKYTGTGGSNGATMRFVPEITDEGNTGLDIARAVLQPVKQKFPEISYSDLWTLGGKVAIEAMGGPTIEWRSGRVDHKDDALVPPNGRLPFADKGADHIRNTFDRMGFGDQEAVALLGAHGLGRCHKKYSGWDGKWTREPTRFLNEFYRVLLEEKWELGTVPETGRQQYYNADKLLMMLNTDMELLQDTVFRHWVEVYAADEARYFADFAAVFARLLQLGRGK